jgi:hypothetical protein
MPPYAVTKLLILKAPFQVKCLEATPSLLFHLFTILVDDAKVGALYPP